jgi:hypothetical protein
MKRIIRLTENQLVGVVKRIYEEFNIDDYDTTDFYDVFFQVFKPWITEKLGDNVSRYPISFLLTKYGQEFIEDMDIVTMRRGGQPREFRTNINSIEHYGKELVKKSHY